LDWFDPRLGQWANRETVAANGQGTIAMPPFPGGLDVAQTDWAAKLKAMN